MTFTSFNLHVDILSALEEADFLEATPIQKQAIPAILSGNDVLALAKTGTGKTAAFGIPIVQRLVTQPNEDKVVRAIILAPTRELAIQIGENIESISKNTSVQVGVIFGGVTPKRHVKVMNKKPDILVATPGRLVEFIERGHVSLEHIEMFVLDEADQMLQTALYSSVKKIISQLPKDIHKMLFSATMPTEVKKLVNQLLKNPLKLSVEETNSSTEVITQRVCFVEEGNKSQALLTFLKEQQYESVIVFVRTKTKADKLSKLINIANIRNKAIHADKGQKERQLALQLFKNKEIKVLIATDVAARGIDIDQLSHVINFNIPNVVETYVHRIGRTGRAGKGGTVISYCSTEEREDFLAISKIQNIEVIDASHN